MECLIHSPAFNCVKLAWVAGVGRTLQPSVLQVRMCHAIRMEEFQVSKTYSLYSSAGLPLGTCSRRNSSEIALVSSFLRSPPRRIPAAPAAGADPLLLGPRLGLELGEARGRPGAEKNRQDDEDPRTSGEAAEVRIQRMRTG